MNRKRLSSAFLLFLLLAAVVLPFMTWVLSMLGFHINNLMSERGLRWLMMNGHFALIPSFFGLFLLGVITIGAMWSSGFIKSFYSHTTMLQRRARTLSLLLLLLAITLFLFFVFWPQSPFLSLVGNFKHSPLIHGMPAIAMLSLSAVSVFYGYYSRTLQSLNQLATVLTYGVTTYGYLIVAVMLCNFLYRAILVALA